MFTSRLRSGFGRWELIALLAIVAVVVALGFPAVQAARESARRNSCLQNQREIGVALQEYESRQGHFPGYINNLNGKRASWVVTLLPFVEQEALAKTWSEASDPPAARLALFICPDDSRSGAPVDQLTYVVSSGWELGESAADGFCFNLYQKGVTPLVNPVTVGRKQVHDGLSQTILMAENIQAEQWSGPFASDDEARRWVSFVWSDEVDTPVHAINDGTTTAPRPTVNMEYARPSSNHRGGTVNVLFADGSSRGITDTIDYGLYKKFLTLDYHHSHATDDGVVGAGCD